jgi:hypothetical protein
VEGAAVDVGLKNHMVAVYREMSIALGISGLVSWFFGKDLKSLMNGQATVLPADLLQSMYSAPFSYILMFAPLAVVMFMGFKMYSMSPAGARTALYGFAALMGISMASIFAIYTGSSIATAFLTTACILAGMSLWGYTTNKDLTGWGSFLMVGVIALIGVSIVNIFIGAAMLTFAINIVAVGIFTALMAYDTQRIKSDYLSMRGQMSEDRISTMGTAGALSMYINFINVFMSLLSLFGNRE